MAGIKEGEELEYSKFLNDWLGKRCQLLIGNKLAEELGYFERFDGSIFKSNDVSFSNHLSAAGLLTEYSDETKMVGLKQMSDLDNISNQVLAATVYDIVSKQFNNLARSKT